MLRTIANRYNVERLLGEGAAGKVYLVKDKHQDDSELALKLLEARGAGHLEHLRHEFSILTKLKHPNIAHVYDFGFDRESGLWYYTSDFLEGENITEAAGKLGHPGKSRLFTQILRALQHIHTQGIVHYDVKPSNIIVDSEGVARLIDFGLAMTETPASGAMRGTIGYAAPEVVRGELGDPRSDLYSLGVVFYEALAGRIPFKGDTVLDVLQMQAAFNPAPLRNLDRTIPVELERVILRLLERDPASRYFSANEVNRALSKAMDIPLEEETAETAMAYLRGGGFIGRDKEFARLKNLVDALRNRFTEPPVCFLTGETGIGKSRLLSEAGYYAQLSGIYLVRCSGSSPVKQPFGPFTDVVRSIAGTLPEDLAEQFASTISALSDGPADAAGAGPGGIIHETTLLLLSAARQRPILISIDDAEDADEDTLSFLEHLAKLLWLKQQQNEHVPLLILVACNTKTGAAKDVVSNIDRLEALGLGGRINLAPISRESVEKLLSCMLGGSELPGQVVQALLDAAGGNPLIIEQTVQQLFESGLLFYEAGKWRASAAIADMQLPVGGEEVLKHRLQALSEVERPVVEAIACAGRAANFDLLCEATGIKADACVGAINRLMSRRLVVSDDNGHYALASGSLGEVSLKEIASEKRRTMHERIYKHLEKTDGNVIDRALQAEMAGINKEDLLVLLKKAAKHAESTAATSNAVLLHEALRRHLPAHTGEWFEVYQRLASLYWQNAGLQKALECFEALDDRNLWKYPGIAVGVLPLRTSLYCRIGKVGEADKFLKKARKKLLADPRKRFHAEVMEAAGQIAAFKGRMQEAHKHWKEARRRFASRKDTEGMNRLDYHIIQIDERAGRYGDAMRRINSVLKRKTTAAARAHMHNAMGAVLLQKGNREKALVEFGRALEQYEKAGRLLDAGCVQANIGAAYKQLAEYEKSLDAFTAAKRLLEVSGDEASYGIALINIGDVYYILCQAREALYWYQMAVELADKTSNYHLKVNAIVLRGAAKSLRGEARSALADCNEAIELAREIDSGSMESFALYNRAYIFAVFCGDFEKADADLKRIRSLDEADNSEMISQAVEFGVWLCLQKGEIDEAAALIGGDRKPGRTASEGKSLTVTRAEVLLGAGKIKEAAKLLESLEGEKLSVTEEHHFTRMKARHALAAGDPLGALGHAEAALKAARRTDGIVMLYTSAVLAAEAAVEAGESGKAADFHKEAEETFEKIASEVPEGYDRRSLRASPFYRPLDVIKSYLGGSKMKLSEAGSPSADSDSGLSETAGAGRQPHAPEELALLRMVTRLATEELDVEKILNLALGMVLDLTQAERGFIILTDDKGNHKHLAARNVLDEEITSPEYETSYTMVREVIRSGKSRLVADVSLEESLREAKSIVDLGLQSVLSVPIIENADTIGVVYLDSTSLARTFSETHLKLVEAFSGRIAPIVTRAVEQAKMQARLRSLQEETRTRYAYTNIIGRSKPMRELFRILDSVTDTDLTVYVYGETGTGKELVAKALHYNSSRKEEPFVSINCAALTESLLESELFGHVKGAFTGADADKTGLIESADKGTLFLDEIGSMSLEMQAKLLRVLEEREIRRIGTAIPVPVDIRLVCSTNIPLEDLVEDGLFREDLFYRINVVRIDLPPLRERRDDVVLLVEHFLELISGEMKASKKEVSLAAMELLIAEDWPGNVRELENRIRRAVALAAEGPILKEHLEGVALADKPAMVQVLLLPDETMKDARDRFERELIISVLENTNYNYSKAAKRIGIERTWLYRRCRQLGIERK